MKDEKMAGKISRAAEIIAGSDHLLAFTGAGISAESGVPTYRGPEGLWNKYDPGETATLSAFKDQPEKFWDFIRDMMVDREIEPNPAHRILADWEKFGLLQGVITQNIDLLHRRAGSECVFELHGSLGEASCYDCGRDYSWEWLEDILGRDDIPSCQNCGSSRIKPDVVFFGEMLPGDILRRAEEEAVKSDVMIVIGSSLAVHPAASLPPRARDTGAELIYINADRGEMPEIFDVILQGSAGEIMQKLDAEIDRL